MGSQEGIQDCNVWGLVWVHANTNKMRISVFNVHLEELNRLLVGETSPLGVVLREQDGSDSHNN